MTTTTTPATGRYYAELRYGPTRADYIASDDPYEIERWVREQALPIIVDDERYDGDGDYIHGSIQWGLTSEMAPNLI